MDARSLPAATYSVDEFCRAYGLGRSTLYKLWKQGAGPRVMHVGKRTLISLEAAAEWQRRLETQQDALAS